MQGHYQDDVIRFWGENVSSQVSTILGGEETPRCRCECAYDNSWKSVRNRREWCHMVDLRVRMWTFKDIQSSSCDGSGLKFNSPTLLALRQLVLRSLLDHDIDRLPASLQNLGQTTDEVHMVCWMLSYAYQWKNESIPVSFGVVSRMMICLVQITHFVVSTSNVSRISHKMFIHY